MNDEQTSEFIRDNLEHIRERAHLVRPVESVMEFVHAVTEIGRSTVILAGNGHIPLPDQGDLSDLDYAALLTSVISVNVRVFVQRPHDVQDSRHLDQLAAAVKQLRAGVDQAVAA